MDLLPPKLIAARYFAEEQKQIDDLNAAAEAATQALEAFTEEHGGDEGHLTEVVNDKGRLTQPSANAALKDAEAAEDEDAIECLGTALILLRDEATVKKAVKKAQAKLDLAVLERYGGLTTPEIEALLLDAKWGATVRDQITSEAIALTLALVARIRELGERYAETVATLDARLEEFSTKVTSHIASFEMVS
jgi:type I restriction enzyme M protein